jgi:hypothetical protein
MQSLKNGRKIDEAKWFIYYQMIENDKALDMSALIKMLSSP